MNARGMMELILLNIGLQRGLITPTLFTILVMMTIGTTLMAGPLFSLRQPRRSGAGPRPPGDSARRSLMPRPRHAGTSSEIVERFERIHRDSPDRAADSSAAHRSTTLTAADCLGRQRLAQRARARRRGRATATTS